MPEHIDLRAYLHRLGFRGAVRPSLETLAEIQRLHVATLAFENLDPVRGEEVRLTPADLQAKLVDGGRGGYCYEHNLLLLDALMQIGFRVRGLAARVFWNGPEDARPPQTHMLLLVEVQGADYLVDVGFGGMTPTGPLRLDRRDAQTTPHEDYRILSEEPLWVLQVRLGERWRTIYKFDLQERWRSDYQIANWYLSHHPESHFVTNVIAALAAPGVRHSLLNNSYSRYLADGRRERRHLANADEVLEVLETVFAIRPPASAALRPRIQRVLDTKAVDE